MKKLDLDAGTLDAVILEMEDGSRIDMKELGAEDFEKFTELMRKLHVAAQAFDGPINKNGN